ncbi:MAG: TlpA family protein disulfide reductase, partial [Deltaproteobacteria bacterium]
MKRPEPLLAALALLCLASGARADAPAETTPTAEEPAPTAPAPEEPTPDEPAPR